MDMPMSDDVRKELLTREGRMAAEELIEEIKPDLDKINAAIARFEEADDKNEEGVVCFMMLALVLSGVNEKAAASAKRFQRRVRMSR